jgi:integral membrane protein (TIGR01906 family)
VDYIGVKFKEDMKILMRFAQIFFIICLPLLVFTVSVAWAVNSTWLYTSGFAKYDVQQTLAENGLEVTATDLKEIASGFVRYFNSGEEYINLSVQVNGQAVPLFNEEEIIHFKDVKGLFRLDYNVLLGTSLYCLAFVGAGLFWRKGNYRHLLARSTVIGSGVSLGIMLIILIAILLDFDSLFYQFHLISFANNFWSAEGNMLLLFPGGFWYDIFTYGALFAVALALIPGIAGGTYLFWLRRKKRSDKHTQSIAEG